MLLAFEWDLLVSVKERHPEMQTDFLTINPEYIVAANKKSGDVDLGLLFGTFDPKHYKDSLPNAISAAGGDGWGPLVSDVTAADVKLAQELGLAVNLWGVETSNEAIDNALAMNADSITTARPDLLRNRFR